MRLNTKIWVSFMAIAHELCNTYPKIHLGAYLEVIQTIQDESHPFIDIFSNFGSIGVCPIIREHMTMENIYGWVLT